MPDDNLTEVQREFKRLALSMGAVDAVVFHIEDIVFDERTILKCMFGCADWGKGHTCPSRPGFPSMEQCRRMFQKYQWGLIIHAHDKKSTQRISYELERRAFHQGYYFAFSLSDCALCAQCAGHEDLPCRNKKMARPAFHSVGIDVFKTARRFGLPIRPLASPDEQQNWYSAVFVE